MLTSHVEIFHMPKEPTQYLRTGIGCRIGYGITDKNIVPDETLRKAIKTYLLYVGG